MRLLEIVADGSPGGGTTHVLQLLSYFKSQYPIALVTQAGSYLEHTAKELMVTTFGINFFASRLDPRVHRHLKEISEKYRPDLIHVHGARAAFFYAQTNNDSPSVYTNHGYHLSRKKPVIKHLAILAERFINQHVSHIVFVSKKDRQLSERFKLNPYFKESSIIYNGIPIEKIPPAESQNKNIGFVGRFVPVKDPMLFLDIVNLLPDYPVIMVGGGELDSAIHKRVKKLGLSQVNLVGLLNHSETLNMLAKMHVLVMTSRREGFGIVSIEAMCSGIPVVAARVGGLEEIIEHKKSGLLIKDRDPEKYKEAVLYLDRNPQVREEIISNAKEKVLKCFTERQMLAKIHNLYAKVYETH